jgi:hypothetical protein
MQKQNCYCQPRFKRATRSSTRGRMNGFFILHSAFYISKSVLLALPGGGADQFHQLGHLKPHFFLDDFAQRNIRCTVSWRTRREMRLTRTLGLPTFSKAFLQSSAFTMLFSPIRARQGSGCRRGCNRKIRCVANNSWSPFSLACCGLNSGPEQPAQDGRPTTGQQHRPHRSLHPRRRREIFLCAFAERPQFATLTRFF